MYRYYATQQPMANESEMILPNNEILSLRCFSDPMLIKASRKSKQDFIAYGYVDYKTPLTTEEMTTRSLFTDKEYLVCDAGVFEVVDYMPLLEIWSIGHHMPDGYIPFCRLSTHQRFPGGRQIDPSYLLAVKSKHAKEIMSMVHITGEHEINEMVKAMEDYLDSGKRGYRTSFKRMLKIISNLKHELNHG